MVLFKQLHLVIFKYHFKVIFKFHELFKIRFGRSPALLRVVDEIMHISPTTAIAPQVILRKARVMKDSGDLHGSIRILDAVISRGKLYLFLRPRLILGSDKLAKCVKAVYQCIIISQRGSNLLK